ncbi:hypothetical protein, partial [Mycolicibacterium brisbanense]|uniref:hypothetical protein n=1 Tax=Mycolicibacterium brisbanense TaxID=146020 RepID=UPI001A7E90CA
MNRRTTQRGIRTSRTANVNRLRKIGGQIHTVTTTSVIWEVVVPTGYRHSKATRRELFDRV